VLHLDNKKLAIFIASLGGLNGYGSTVKQTIEAIKSGNTKVLSSKEDEVIFEDALKGIEEISKIGFSADGIIGINKKFDGDSEEQPKLPGHLRNSYYNADDGIAVEIDDTGRNNYIPPEIITKEDLEKIVLEYNSSSKSTKDSWRVFVKISKLQPFQDGNKRTALIAANASSGALKTQDYLLVPLDPLDRMDFTTNLMRYYKAIDTVEEDEMFERFYRFISTVTITE
jgi:hypothetical protein